MRRRISERIVKETFVKRVLDNLIARELQKRTVEFNHRRGMPIAVFGNDWIGLNINVHGLYEKEHLGDLERLINEMGIDSHKSTVLDIGANIGNHALEFSRYFKRVLCFEPNPRTFRLLKANASNVDNIDVFNVGCGSRSELIMFRENYSNLGGSSAKVSFDHDGQIDVEINPLDHFLETLTEVALIKVDVEGMELDVLHGAENIIRKFCPMICFEQNEYEFSESFRETETIDWLRERDYKIFALRLPDKRNYLVRRINNIKQAIFGFVQLREIVEFAELPKGNYSMVYAIHSSKLP